MATVFRRFLDLTALARVGAGSLAAAFRTRPPLSARARALARPARPGRERTSACAWQEEAEQWVKTQDAADQKEMALLNRVVT